MTATEVDPRAGFTTPAPLCVVPPPAPTLLEKRVWEMEFHEKAKIRAAAFRATKLYPGGVGELLSRELLSFEEFGQRLDQSGLVMRAVRDILTTDLNPRSAP